MLRVHLGKELPLFFGFPKRNKQSKSVCKYEKDPKVENPCIGSSILAVVTNHVNGLLIYHNPNEVIFNKRGV